MSSSRFLEDMRGNTAGARVRMRLRLKSSKPRRRTEPRYASYDTYVRRSLKVRIPGYLTPKPRFSSEEDRLTDAVEKQKERLIELADVLDSIFSELRESKDDYLRAVVSLSDLKDAGPRPGIEALLLVHLLSDMDARLHIFSQALKNDGEGHIAEFIQSGLTTVNAISSQMSSYNLDGI